MKTYRWVAGLSAAVVFATVVTAQKVAPKPLSTPSPHYPAELVDTGLSGVANLEFTITAEGTVTDAKVASADHPAFGAAALATISDWKFEPGTRDGVAVALPAKLPFQFRAPFEQQVNAAFKRKVFVALAEPALTTKEFGGKLKVKTDAKPVYPKALARSGVRQSVKVSYVVAPDGTVVNPKVEGEVRRELISPAITAVAKMAYQPPLKEGKGVYVRAEKTLKFEEPQPDMGERGGRGGGGRRGGGMGGMGGMGGGGMGDRDPFGGGGGGGGPDGF